MARREEEIEDFFSHFSPAAPGSVGYVGKCWTFKGEKRINSLSFFSSQFHELYEDHDVRSLHVRCKSVKL